MSLKAALIQLNAGVDREKNISRATALVERAINKRAEFVVLPEVFNYRGHIRSARALKGVSEKIPGPSTRPLMALARKSRIFILAGSLLEKSRTKKAYNTSVLIGPDGKVRVKYRKRKLFDARIGKTKLKESQLIMAGKEKVVANIRGFKAGLSICYDLRFPVLYRDYARLGAHILCVPSSFTKKTGKAHWETLLRARAIENQCYVLAPNQTGKDGKGVPTYGHSLIVDPWGRVLADAGTKEEAIIYAALNKKDIQRCRKILPSAKR